MYACYKDASCKMFVPGILLYSFQNVVKCCIEEGVCMQTLRINLEVDPTEAIWEDALCECEQQDGFTRKRKKSDPCGSVSVLSRLLPHLSHHLTHPSRHHLPSQPLVQVPPSRNN